MLLFTKASLPISTSSLGKVTSFKNTALAKAYESILLIPSGILYDSIPFPAGY